MVTGPGSGLGTGTGSELRLRPEAAPPIAIAVPRDAAKPRLGAKPDPSFTL